VVDVPFPMVFYIGCVATPDTTTGSTCAVATTANTVIPGIIKEAQRTVMEIGQILIEDGGSDGAGNSEADNTLFARQGVFVP
jgi:hypothetical protein